MDQCFNSGSSSSWGRYRYGFDIDVRRYPTEMSLSFLFCLFYFFLLYVFLIRKDIMDVLQRETRMPLK